MHLRPWLVPLCGAFLLAGAFALHADAPQASPSRWRGQPIAQPASPSQPAPGGTEKGIVPPILDGTWWKLKVSCKGYTVAPDGLTAKESVKFTSYMQLTANVIEPLEGPGDGSIGGVPTYIYVVWTEDLNGNWAPSYSDEFLTTGADENFDATLSVNTFMGFIFPGFAVASLHSGTLDTKRDSEGVLKSAKLKTIGAEMIESTVTPVILLGGGGDTAFYGRMTISGSTIDPGKLPFNPEI